MSQPVVDNGGLGSFADYRKPFENVPVKEVSNDEDEGDGYSRD